MTRGHCTWTAERAAFVRRSIEVFEDYKTLASALNELPGAPIKSTRAVRIYMNKHGLALQARLRQLGERGADRVNLLLELRREGVEWAEIKAEINKLPGAPIQSVKAVWQKHSMMRSAFASAPPAAPAPDSPVRLPVAMPKPPALLVENGALLMSYDAARRLALRTGVCSKYTGLDLHALNAAMAARNMPRIVIAGAL